MRTIMSSTIISSYAPKDYRRLEVMHNFMFVAMTVISAANFYSFEISKLGNTPQSTRESWIPTSILAILWAILCYGLSDKVYI